MSNRRKHFNKAVSDSYRTVSEADQGVVYSDNGPTVAYSSSSFDDSKGALASRLDSKSTSAIRNFTKKYNRKHR